MEEQQQQRHPWQEMRRLQQQMERLIGGVSPSLRWPLTADEPPINVRRDQEHVTIDALCPGAKADTLDVTVIGDVVTIRGERRRFEESDQVLYHRRERPQASFTRAISMNDRLDPDSAEAAYRNGVLSVRIKRVGEPPPRKITINR